MKRWLWFFSSLLISTGVYFTIRYGLRPKPIPVMNATEFENAEQIGAVVYRRLRQEVRTERVLLLGSAPELPGYAEIWTGFLKTALADQIKVDIFYAQDSLVPPQNVGAWELVKFNDAMIQSGDFLTQVTGHLQAGHIVVIYGPTRQITHLNGSSLSRLLDDATHHPVLALSTLDLTLKAQDQKQLQAQCLEASGEGDGAQRIECAEARVGKVLLKKKIPAAKLWAVMERHGLKEYLLFVHR